MPGTRPESRRLMVERTEPSCQALNAGGGDCHGLSFWSSPYPLIFLFAEKPFTYHSLFHSALSFGYIEFSTLWSVVRAVVMHSVTTVSRLSTAVVRRLAIFVPSVREIPPPPFQMERTVPSHPLLSSLDYLRSNLRNHSASCVAASACH